MAKWNTAQRISMVLLITVIGSVFPVLIANSIGKSFYTKQAKLYEEQLEIQARHYEELAKRNIDLRRFKHDYKNMLIGVEKLIQDGNTTDALQLLHKEHDNLSPANTHTVFDTGNGIVDAILGEKQRKAETVNSTISFEGAIPTEKIAPTDLCTIFGNTLDNAIEACEKVQSDTEKQISVVCKSVGGFMFVNIRNPIEELPRCENNRLKTSKKDTLNHGFGLYSLKKSVKKYDGNVHFAYTDKQFSVDLEIMVPV